MPDRAALARIPKVDAVLAMDVLERSPWRRSLVRRVVQDALARVRTELLLGEDVHVPDAERLAASVASQLKRWMRPRPSRVLNATGVLLHTNLGRAPLSADAVAAMTAATGYCDLEVSLQTGTRNSRFEQVSPLVAALLGCEDAHVVNNNAAALLLACTVFGLPGGVVLSRGQMVEIGDNFRVATMAAAGGARIVAVGSTNRTHLRDYEQALLGEGPEANGRRASALLWCHQSNFRQSGYVKAVSLRELAKLARDHNVPLIADLGSGSLGRELSEQEPTIGAYLEQGVELVLASGDKLLGGPQSGIVAGRREWVERCRRHPMSRALRIDKVAVAALHATFVQHARVGVPKLPLFEMAGAPLEHLRARARRICAQLGWDPVRVVSTNAAIGGGSLPGDTLASVAVWVPANKPQHSARRLREFEPPVFARIEGDRLLCDLRTLAPREDSELIAALRTLTAPR